MHDFKARGIQPKMAMMLVVVSSGGGNSMNVFGAPCVCVHIMVPWHTDRLAANRILISQNKIGLIIDSRI